MPSSSDSHRALPVGKWKLSRSRVRPSDHAEVPPTFWAFAMDEQIEDCVKAFIAIGDLSDYEFEALGPADGFESPEVVASGTYRPRIAKATGGTTALLKYMSLADRDGIWMTTEVKTDSIERDQIVRAFLERWAGFRSTDPQYVDMMTRKPITP